MVGSSCKALALPCSFMLAGLECGMGMRSEKTRPELEGMLLLTSSRCCFPWLVKTGVLPKVFEVEVLMGLSFSSSWRSLKTRPVATILEVSS